MTDAKLRTYADIAYAYAKRSTCCSKHVGAVIFDYKTDRIIAAGYNGVPSGMTHCKNIMYKQYDGSYEVYTSSKDLLEKLGVSISPKMHKEFSRKYEIHAEQNAIYNIIKQQANVSGMELAMVITLSPCEDCAKAIVAAGIKHVHYIDMWDEWPLVNALAYFNRLGVSFEYLRY